MLRRVILHRPDLELKRLTPHNKDALLFDDVLWVRRARQEHDAFADALADRGVEVLYLERLLADVLREDDGARRGADAHARRGRPRAELGRATCASGWRASTPPSWPRRLIGGITVRRAAVPLHGAAAPRSPRSTASCSRRCPTTCSRATRRRGSTTACRSTRWRWPRAGASRCTTTPSTATTRCSPHPGARVERRDRRARAARGRRRPRHRQRLRARRHGRAHPAGRRRAPRPGPVRGRLRAPGDRRRHAGAALDDAPRHGDDDGRSRRVHDLPRRPPVARRLLAAARGRPGSPPSARTTCSPRSPARSTFRRCGCSRRAATATRPSASSGTTATTSWPWRRASSSPTSATSTPTRGCAARGSR